MIGQPFATNAGPRYAVRFLSQWQNYFRGDVASFPARMAMRLVERGKVERVNIAAAGQEAPDGAQWTIRLPAEPPYRQGGGDDVIDL